MLYSTLWGTKYYVTPAWHKGSYAVPPNMRRRATPRSYRSVARGDLTFRVSTVKSKRCGFFAVLSNERETNSACSLASVAAIYIEDIVAWTL